MEGGRAVGFIGLIFSRREIGGRVERFCNVSSIATIEAHRHESMALIKPLLQLKEYTITNFTPTPAVSAVLGRLGFQSLDETMHILLPVPGWSSSADAPRGRYRILSGADEIRERLNDRDRAIFDHHQFPHCWHVVIAGEQDYCHVVFSRTKGRRRSFSFVHRLSHPAIFFANLNRAKLAMFRKSGTPFIMVMDRHVKGRALGRVRTTAVRHPAIFKSEHLKPEQIDSLYSELVLLNL